MHPEPAEDQPDDAAATEDARRAIKRAERGDASGARRLDQTRATDPEGAEAAEQEASEAPPGRGLSR